MDFKNYFINAQSHISYLQKWMGNNKIIFVTQQLSNQNFFNNDHFFNKTNLYKLIYPENIYLSQTVHLFTKTNKITNKFNNEVAYIFTDIKIH